MVPQPTATGRAILRWWIDEQLRSMTPRGRRGRRQRRADRRRAHEARQRHRP
ncbi:MAG TPA: hypothetical protein VM121_03195 [Acidimicrobiales bacterium]|nr:hypothetical protein [Acidimicrobiales bacterium]